MRNGQLTAIEWLTIVSIKSKDSEARRLARFALDQWKMMDLTWKANDAKSRKSLWDLIAGVKNFPRKDIHQATMVEVNSCGKTFYFPVFAEACARRAKSDRGAGAVRAGVPVNSERLPQTTKWGNKVCRT